MYIAREFKQKLRKLRRSGMELCVVAPHTCGHAAPPGLRKVIGVRGGYKHGAPPELGHLHLHQRGLARANLISGANGGGRHLFPDSGVWSPPPSLTSPLVEPFQEPWNLRNQTALCFSP